jgi:exodeoxyribonuclease VII large subunit
MKLEYLSEKLDHYSRCTADARKRYEDQARQFDRILSSVVKTQQNRVAQSRNRLVYAESSRLAKERTWLEQQRLMLTQTVATAAAQQKMRIANDSNLLDAYSPLKVLGRGYSIVEKDGQTVTDARTLQPNDRISIRMNQGSVSAEVLKAEGGPGNGGKEKDI